MLNRQEFFIYIKEHVTEHLDASFEDADVRLQEVTKQNGIVLTGLNIIRKGESISPNIYLDALYEDYLYGNISATNAVRAVADERSKFTGLEPVYDESIIKNYDLAKQHLYVVLSDRALFEKRPSTDVYTNIGDFSARYYVEVGECCGCCVKGALLDEWGITKEQLHKDALSCEAAKGFCLYSLEEMALSSGPAANYLDREAGARRKEPLVLTSSAREGMYGASAILQQDVLAKAAELIGESYFVLPSSVHEVILMPESFSDVKTLRQMVIDANTNLVSFEDVLSNHVQYYDRDTGELNRAVDRSESRFAEHLNSKAPATNPVRRVKKETDLEI